jgi:threonine dehydrogenase-like Zn-dependent dehydrogenase
MKALVFQNELSFTADYPMPVLGYNEALIRVSSAGICGTDLAIAKGYMGFSGVPGHEFAGIVEKCGDEEWVGKRVAGEINIGCGVCSYCFKGRQNHCPSRSVLGILKKDGAFAEYITLPTRNLHIVPDAVSDDEAVFIEPLAAAFEITSQVNIRPEDKVCVLGDGRLGLLIGQVVSLTGCDLIVAGKWAEKLDVIKKMGIKTEMSSALGAREFDYVIECSGSKDGLKRACGLVMPGGAVILKTTSAESGAFDLNRVVIDEISIVGSRCGPFTPAIRSLERKMINVTSLISGIFPIEDGVEAFKFASNKGSLKAIIKVNHAIHKNV